MMHRFETSGNQPVTQRLKIYDCVLADANLPLVSIASLRCIDHRMVNLCC